MLAWTAGGLMMRGVSVALPASAPPAQDLRIASDQGISLAATYRPGARPDAPGVLLLHGVDASRGAVAGNAAWLAAQGYATLAVDFRGHGESTRRSRSFGWHEAADAHAAFAWLKRRQSGARIAIIGISMGGAASLVGPRGPVRADAIILQAVYPDIRRAIRHRIAARLGAGPAALLEPLLSMQARPRIGVWPSAIAPAAALTRFDGAVMVIGGIRDGYTPPADTRTLFAAARDGRRLWLVPLGDHAAICAKDDAVYRRRIVSFLRSTIG